MRVSAKPDVGLGNCSLSGRYSGWRPCAEGHSPARILSSRLRFAPWPYRSLPCLRGLLAAIGVFRASGILDALVGAVKSACQWSGIDNSFADALPTALMKPLSGSGARAMMIETMQNYGADSFAAFTASVVQGSTETTFYVLTVYFGAVNIAKTRYALKYALLSDLAGIGAAIFFSYMFYTR